MQSDIMQNFGLVCHAVHIEFQTYGIVTHTKTMSIIHFTVLNVMQRKVSV